MGIMAVAAGCSAALDVQLTDVGAPESKPTVQQGAIATVAPGPDPVDSAMAAGDPATPTVTDGSTPSTPGPETTTGPTVDVAPTPGVATAPSPIPEPTSTPLPRATATAVPTPTATPTPTPVVVGFIIGPNAALLGVAIGAEADDAMSMLAAAIGEPDFDTDWYVGCPLDGDELNERLVQWGDLNVYFERFDGTEKFRAWGYDLRIVEGGYPEIDLIELPGGSRMGDPVNVVAAAAGLDVVYDELFDINRVGVAGFEIVSDAPPGAPVWGAFVPSVPACE